MVMEGWRHIVMFDDLVIIWRGLDAKYRVYSLTRERARRIGRLLDGCAEIRKMDGGSLAYVWNDWNWHNIGGK